MADGGSCGGLQGSGIVDGAGEERLAEDDARDTGVAQAAQAVEVTTPPATRKSASYDRTSEARPNQVGLGAAMGQDEPGDPGSDELADERLERGWGTRPAPRERGEPIRPRVEPDGQPVARDSQARAQVRRADRRCPSRAPPAWRRPRRRDGRGRRLQPAGELQRHGDLRGDGPDRVEIARGAGARALEVDQVDTGAPSATKRSAIRSGRSVGAPIPAAAPGQYTIRERPRSRSIEGMTCTRSGAWAVGQQTAMEADRERAIAEQRVVERLEAEPVAQPALLVVAQPEDAAAPSR